MDLKKRTALTLHPASSYKSRNANFIKLNSYVVPRKQGKRLLEEPIPILTISSPFSQLVLIR